MTGVFTCAEIPLLFCLIPNLYTETQRLRKIRFSCNNISRLFFPNKVHPNSSPILPSILLLFPVSLCLSSFLRPLFFLLMFSLSLPPFFPLSLLLFPCSSISFFFFFLIYLFINLLSSSFMFSSCSCSTPPPSFFPYFFSSPLLLSFSSLSFSSLFFPSFVFLPPLTPPLPSLSTFSLHPYCSLLPPPFPPSPPRSFHSFILFHLSPSLPFPG